MSARAYALDLGIAESAWSIEIHGFVSQGFLLSTHNNYLAKSSQGSFEFTEIGLNFTKPLTDRLRVALQLFSRELGPIGNYSIKADWFELSYRYRDWLGMRAGRVKVPFGFYNDMSDIDSARAPVLLPQSVYPTNNRDMLLAHTGGEIFGYARIGAAGALDYRVYGGTTYLEPTPNSAFRIDELNIPYILGSRLIWESPIPGLRAAGTIQLLKLETVLTALSGSSPNTFNLDIRAIMWIASLEYAYQDFIFAAEYSRWHLKTTTSDPVRFPPSTSSPTSERAYAMASYRLRRWLQLSAYYALLYPDTTKRSGREAQQHDACGTLRFDINDYWLVKLEGHYMYGTAVLSPTYNANVPTNLLDANWGMFLLKTTAYF